MGSAARLPWETEGLAADASLPVRSAISIHDGFVEEKKCASCHAGQAAAFAKSNHAKAMALADESTVRANFDSTRFEHDGILTTFFKRDGRFFVRTEGPDGTPAEFEVKYTFAYEPLQQYLIDMGGGRLQALDIAWDTTKREWFWLGYGQAGKAGHDLPLDRPLLPLEPDLHRLPLHRSASEFSAGDRRIQIDLCRDQHRLPVLPRRRRETCGMGRGGRRVSRLPITGLRPSIRLCAWAAMRDGPSFSPDTGLARPSSIISLPTCCAGTSTFPTDRSWMKSSSTARFSRARWQGPASCASTATNRTRRRSRPKATPSARNATPRQAAAVCGLRPERQFRHAGPYPPPGRLRRRPLRQLPHARAHLHEGRPPAGPLLRHSAARPVDRLRHPERLHGLP